MDVELFVQVLMMYLYLLFYHDPITTCIMASRFLGFVIRKSEPFGFWLPLSESCVPSASCRIS